MFLVFQAIAIKEQDGKRNNQQSGKKLEKSKLKYVSNNTGASITDKCGILIWKTKKHIFTTIKHDDVRNTLLFV